MLEKVLDLSRKLQPGKEERRLEIHPFVYEEDGTYMHDVEIMSHLGTHIEAPSHLEPELPDIASLPLEKFFGPAVCIDVSQCGKGGRILPEDICQIEKNNILLLHSRWEGEEAPWISREAAEFLVQLPIKLLGIGTTIRLEESMKEIATHRALLPQNIPIVEGLYNLDKVVGKRFVFFALPLYISGLDSSPIRAIAILDPPYLSK